MNAISVSDLLVVGSGPDAGLADDNVFWARAGPNAAGLKRMSEEVEGISARVFIYREHLQ